MTEKNPTISAQTVRNSRSHKKAQRMAEQYAHSPEKLNQLVEKASQKAANNTEKHKKGPLKEIWEQLMACFRLLRAYAKGQYRHIPWQSLLMVIASVVYFVMPLDLLPDILAGLGYLDDATLLTWTLKAIGADIDEFLEWEAKHPSEINE